MFLATLVTQETRREGGFLLPSCGGIAMCFIEFYPVQAGTFVA